jgi:protein-disulfide isomerase
VTTAGRALLAVLLSVPVLGSAAPDNMDVVATIDSGNVTEKQLDGRAEQTIADREKEYQRQATILRLNFERSRDAYKERMLNKLVDEHVLAAEARARHTTTTALLEAQKGEPVTDAQVRAVYEQKKAELHDSYENASATIRDYLHKSAVATAQRGYVDTLRAKYHAVVLLEPRRESVAATGPARGPADAPVTIVEFADFQCPFCGRLEPVLAHTLTKYGAQVRLVYRNFPLGEIHPQAQKAAEAAFCAQEQGKFWEMHDLMFAEQDSLGVEDLKIKAQRLGLDRSAFDQCLDGGKERDAIALDAEGGDGLGIEGTPACFVNGRFLSGAVEESELDAIIDDELRRAHH